MRLENVSIKNYRSISKAVNLPISDLTTLVGANNEGKSNFLRAIALSLSILSKGRTRIQNRARTSRYYYGDVATNIDYKWNRDFPIAIQEKTPDGRSEFILEFQLNDQDYHDFKVTVGSNLQTNLRIKLMLGREEAKLEFILKGKGKQFLADRQIKIANFLAGKIQIQYIPAVRTETLAREAVNSLLDAELGQLETRPDYLNLLAGIAALQKPILTKLSKQLAGTIAKFIPDVKSIRIETDSRIRSAMRSAFTVHVNDGVDTELELKGDGIKSLTAISLLRHVSQEALGNKFLILAIEEPESHLHPQEFIP
jgi:predicted ATP-dependent endonuclease of OLD family